MTEERLIYFKTLHDGRVMARNVQEGGWQYLVFPNRTAFDRAKIAVEERGEPVVVTGYAAV